MIAIAADIVYEEESLKRMRDTIFTLWLCPTTLAAVLLNFSRNLDLPIFQIVSTSKIAVDISRFSCTWAVGRRSFSDVRISCCPKPYIWLAAVLFGMLAIQRRLGNAFDDLARLAVVNTLIVLYLSTSGFCSGMVQPFFA